MAQGFATNGLLDSVLNLATLKLQVLLRNCTDCRHCMMDVLICDTVFARMLLTVFVTII